MEKKITYNYEAVKVATNVSIESHMLNALTSFNIRDPELLALDLEGFVPAQGFSPQKSQGICKEWVMVQRSKPQVSTFFTKQVQDNNVQVNIGTLKIEKKIVKPIGGSLEPLFETNQARWARDVANILLLHTTSKRLTIVEEWVDRAKAKKIGIPYINCSQSRRLLSVIGNDNFLTRDQLYQKLMNPSAEGRCVLMYCLSEIYNNPDMIKFSVEDGPCHAYYSKHRPDRLGDIKNVRVPIMQKVTYTIPVVHDSIWILSVWSGQTLGDKRKRGAVSVGYYRYDIAPSEVSTLDLATDLINICRRYKYKAIRIQSNDTVLFTILNANGISVYTNRVQLNQPKDKVGVFSHGKDKCFSWGMFSQNPPQVIENVPVLPKPLIFDKKSEPFFNYVYIPKEHDTNLQYLPSIRASDGVCIATNTSVTGIKIIDLMSRFARAVVFRNNFPYTRLTFLSQDPMREWFMSPWIYPRQRDKGAIDLFKVYVQEVVEVDEEDSTVIISNVRTVFADPTPEELGKTELERHIELLDNNTLLYLYRCISDGNFSVPDDRIKKCLAVLSVDCIKSELLYAIRIRKLARHSPHDEKNNPDEDSEDSGGPDEAIREDETTQAEVGQTEEEMDLFNGATTFDTYESK